MQEKELRLMSGWPMLAVALLTPFVLVALFITQNPIAIGIGVLLAIAWFVSLFGFIVVNPNEARVVQLFVENQNRSGYHVRQKQIERADSLKLRHFASRL